MLGWAGHWNRSAACHTLRCSSSCRTCSSARRSGSAEKSCGRIKNRPSPRICHHRQPPGAVARRVRSGGGNGLPRPAPPRARWPDRQRVGCARLAAGAGVSAHGSRRQGTGRQAPGLAGIRWRNAGPSRARDGAGVRVSEIERDLDELFDRLAGQGAAGRRARSPRKWHLERGDRGGCRHRPAARPMARGQVRRAGTGSPRFRVHRGHAGRPDSCRPRDNGLATGPPFLLPAVAPVSHPHCHGAD
jgi:hypothetical protein